MTVIFIPPIHVTWSPPFNKAPLDNSHAVEELNSNPNLTTNDISATTSAKNHPISDTKTEVLQDVIFMKNDGTNSI